MGPPRGVGNDQRHKVMLLSSSCAYIVSQDAGDESHGSTMTTGNRGAGHTQCIAVFNMIAKYKHECLLAGGCYVCDVDDGGWRGAAHAGCSGELAEIRARS